RLRRDSAGRARGSREPAVEELQQVKDVDAGDAADVRAGGGGEPEVQVRQQVEAVDARRAVEFAQAGVDGVDLDRVIAAVVRRAPVADLDEVGVSGEQVYGEVVRLRLVGAGDLSQGGAVSAVDGRDQVKVVC